MIFVFENENFIFEKNRHPEFISGSSVFAILQKDSESSSE